MLRNVTLGLCLLLCQPGLGQDDDKSPVEADIVSVDFNRHIRPIFNKHCTSCHGGVRQAADVSFIYREQSLDAGIIVPGDPDDSELIARVVSDDPDLRMPPPEEHPDPLGAEEIQLLRRWIAQGAEWGTHWSLKPPIDRFEERGRSRIGRVSRSTILCGGDCDRKACGRRPRPRLRNGSAAFPLTSPAAPGGRAATDVSRHAGRCAAPSGSRLRRRRRATALVTALCRTLDCDVDGLARYADTMGFEKDPHRDMWPYRDWLIQAFNEDMPFDHFTWKQLAGDLLDGATTDDLIATAFHRNTQTNTEGGTDDEEFRTAAVIDRINTTWTVWQATTFGCVQCHAHPYDPFRHEEYYQCMAFFNNTEDHDLDDDFPTLRVPADAEQRVRLSSLVSRRRA